MFDSLPAGDYEGKLVREGYENIEFSATINTGILSGKNFSMKVKES